MEQELRATQPDLNIEILGVNDQNQVAYNYLISQSSALPWLQDTATANVWTNWGVTWRDVRILDSANRLQAVFNLTQYDLSVPTNYATLRQLFLQTARAVDTDGNGLPDDWETKYFGSLSNNPHADPDGDGSDNVTEFAFGSDPTNPYSVPEPLSVVLISGGAQPILTVAARRRTGSWLIYVIESSPDLRQWSATPATLVFERNRFDGTGSEDAGWVVTNTAGGQSFQFLRIRASPR